MTDISALPVVVIGAGPVGLAAAAQLVERNLPFVILEKSATVAAVPKAWGHVRLFSPWRYNVDAAAARLLSGSGWQSPDPDALPTGETLATDYLEPLARHRSIASNLTLEARVTGITREGLDKMASREREASPLLVHWIDGCGTRHRTLARAVIDASGTFDRPNPILDDILFGSVAADPDVALGRLALRHREREHGESAGAVGIEQRGFGAAKIRQPCLVAAVLLSLCALAVVVDQPDLPGIGVTVDEQVDPEVGVVDVDPVDRRKHLEQQLLRDVRAGLMGAVGESVVTAQSLDVPRVRQPTVFREPIAQVHHAR